MITVSLPHPNLNLVGAADARSRLATPALVIELKAFEGNLAAMAQAMARAGVSLRPHAKTHKCAEIARRQIALGALGQCVAKLGEAESLAAQGIDGLLVTSPLATPGSFERAAAMNLHLEQFLLVVDSFPALDGLQRVAERSGKPIQVLIDVDIGMHRTGVQPGQAALALARAVATRSYLRLMGLQGYGGHLQHIEDAATRRTLTLEALSLLRETRDLLNENGFDCPIVSGGGTGTFQIDIEAGVFTEIQAGSYAFMDKEYNAVQDGPVNGLPFETALFVETTVISANTAGIATTDAGLKSFATEAGAPVIAGGAPEGTKYFFFGDEQGGLAFSSANERLEPGARVRCVTPHCDPTVNLYDVYHAMDGDRLVALWPIEARGRSA
jgi:D-serine deaminase-like pyridoxal phosphate-dependent protein